jgi:hypothetical protein
LQNNLAELWSLLNFILLDIFSSHQEFESWYYTIIHPRFPICFFQYFIHVIQFILAIRCIIFYLILVITTQILSVTKVLLALCCCLFLPVNNLRALTFSSFIFQGSLILIVKHQMLVALMEKTPRGFHGIAT